MKKYIIAITLFIGCWACSSHDIEVYHGERYLFFPDSAKDLNQYAFSFSHFPDLNERSIPFYIALTGPASDKDLEFKLVVVDSLTTAQPEDYILPENTVFGAGKTIDRVNITVRNSRPALSNERVYVTFRIAENNNFKPGLIEYQDIRITFDNIKSAPLWWTGDVERLMLGEYSDLKFEHFIRATGVNDLTDMELAEVRELVLRFKKYLYENNIMDEDGVTPMADGVPGR